MNDPITGLPNTSTIPESTGPQQVVVPEYPVTTEPIPTEMPPQAQVSAPVVPNTLPPLPPQIVAPQISTPEVSNGLVVKKKGYNIKKIVMAVLFICFLAGLGLGGVKAYNSMKLQFNPLVSPVIENLIYSPGEQFTSRLNLFIDTVAVGVTSELQDLNYTVDTDFTDIELATYKKDIGSKLNGTEISFDTKSTIDLAEPISGVLGITSTPGKIDQSFLTELSSAKRFVVTVAGTQSVEFSNRTNPKTVGTVGIQLELPNSQISTTIDSRYLDKFSYVMPKSFPENDYLDLSSIMNKWILISSPVTTDASTRLTAKDLIKKATIKKSGIENIKKVLAVEEFSKRVKSAPSISSNGVTSKCYMINLDTASAIAITKAMQAKATELKMTKESVNNVITEDIANTSAASTETTICFANSQFVPTSITTNTTYTEKDNSYQFLSRFTFSPLSTSTSFTAPSSEDVIKVENIDSRSLLKGDVLALYDSSLAMDRNYQRQLALSRLSILFSSYDVALGNSKKDFGKIPLCKTGSAKIAFIETNLVPAGTINIYPLLTKKVIENKEEIPKEPTGGTYTNIGYTVCLASNGLLQFSAPNAENGVVITE